MLVESYWWWVNRKDLKILALYWFKEEKEADAPEELYSVLTVAESEVAAAGREVLTLDPAQQAVLGGEVAEHRQRRQVNLRHYMYIVLSSDNVIVSHL